MGKTGTMRTLMVRSFAEEEKMQQREGNKCPWEAANQLGSAKEERKTGIKRTLEAEKSNKRCPGRGCQRKKLTEGDTKW